MNYLVIGGTGTLGKKIIERLLGNPSTQKVACFSRCELKQADMRKEYRDARLRFFLGDIRDSSSLQHVFDASKFDVVFHVAALKHIDILEDNPIESVNTNIMGTLNVARACIYNCVKHMVFSSTDKAVEPINTYGMCKSISEKLLLNFQKEDNNVNFSIYRWGNIFFSRGSALSFFKETLTNEQKVYLTCEDMTRFWLDIEEAVDFIFSTFEQMSNAPKIPPLKAASIVNVVKAIAENLGVTEYETQIVGLRRGEKMHEKIEENGLTSGEFEHFEHDELSRRVRRYL